MVANYHFSISADVSLPRCSTLFAKWRWWLLRLISIDYLATIEDS